MAGDTVSIRAALNSLDCATQQTTGRVVALCNAAKQMLLCKDADALKTVYVMLGAIEEAVLTLENDVNATAEDQGCNWIDESERQVFRQLASRSTDDSVGIMPPH